MPPDIANDELFALQRDMEIQQLRVLLLIDAVSKVPGTGGKLDGLTKLAKLDFICRYEGIAPAVANALKGESPAMETALRSEFPMTRHKFGPWDDHYYPVIGALVGRGLVTYSRGKRGSVAMKLTRGGRSLVATLEDEDTWTSVAAKYRQIAVRFGLETGNRLKDAIYATIPAALDVPHRTVLK